jgi:hypothetical protein
MAALLTMYEPPLPLSTKDRFGYQSFDFQDNKRQTM